MLQGVQTLSLPIFVTFVPFVFKPFAFQADPGERLGRLYAEFDAALCQATSCA